MKMFQLFIFSTFEKAVSWCEHYKNFNKLGYLLGILKKEEGYDNLFLACMNFGVKRIMFDEGNRYINMTVKVMLNFNNILEVKVTSMPKFALIERK